MQLELQRLDVVSKQKELGCKLWLQLLLSAPSPGQGELEKWIKSNFCFFLPRFKFLPFWIQASSAGVDFFLLESWKIEVERASGGHVIHLLPQGRINCI